LGPEGWIDRGRKLTEGLLGSRLEEQRKGRVINRRGEIPPARKASFQNHGRKIRAARAWRRYCPNAIATKRPWSVKERSPLAGTGLFGKKLGSVTTQSVSFQRSTP